MQNKPRRQHFYILKSQFSNRITPHSPIQFGLRYVDIIQSVALKHIWQFISIGKYMFILEPPNSSSFLIRKVVRHSSKQTEEEFNTA